MVVGGITDNSTNNASWNDVPLLSDTTVMEFGEWSECGEEDDG